MYWGELSLKLARVLGAALGWIFVLPDREWTCETTDGEWGGGIWIT